MNRRRLAITSGLAGAFTASLCCAGPLILALFGLLSISAAGALGEALFRRYWWVFVSGGLTITVGSVLWAMRPGRNCPADEATRLHRARRNTLALAVGIFVGGYLVWDFVIVESVGIHLGAWSNPLR